MGDCCSGGIVWWTLLVAAAWADEPALECEPTDEATYDRLVDELGKRSIAFEARRQLDPQLGWKHSVLASVERNTPDWHLLTSAEHASFGCRPLLPQVREEGAVPLDPAEVAQRLQRAVSPMGRVDTRYLTARYRRHTSSGTLTLTVSQWPGGGQGRITDPSGAPMGEVLWCGGQSGPARDALARIIPSAVWSYHLPAASGQLPALAASALVPSDRGEWVVITLVEEDTTWRLMVDPLTYQAFNMTQTPAMDDARFTYSDYRQTSAGLVLPHVIQVEILNRVEERIELLQMDSDPELVQREAQSRCIKKFGLEP